MHQRGWRWVRLLTRGGGTKQRGLEASCADGVEVSRTDLPLRRKAHGTREILRLVRGVRFTL